ncbi:MAG: response regulator [Bryobacteraceae bacterium]
MTAAAEAPKPDLIVVIDDEEGMRLACKKILTKSGFEVNTFADGAQGLDGIVASRPALVLLDLKMPGMSGIEVVGRIHEIDPQIVVVIITGYATIDTAVEAMKSGAYDFLPKPFSPDELRLIVNRGIERRRLALETQRCEVERLMLRRRFVTFVSHQLQTPLVAIHQYLDSMRYLEGPDAEAKRREWLDRCLKRTAELQQIIRDWLTLARIEGQSLSRERIVIDLKPVIANIVQTYEQAAAQEGLSMELSMPRERYLVKGSVSCLNVLFDNLVANAIKYNKPGGSVTVSAETRDGQVIVAVRDTGVGIPEKYQPMIFDEFFRVTGEDAKKTPGTGLGLPICKRIVSEMGGTIEVESRPGEGSTFRVTLLGCQETAQNGGANDAAGEDRTDCG